MYKPRDRAVPPNRLEKISLEDHVALRQSGERDHKFWDVKIGPDAVRLKKFRKEIKTHYWYIQGRRCCYCSKELDSHQGSYDAEHILPKVDFPQFMFEFVNLAIGCKTCNGRKSNKAVCSGTNDLVEVPLNTDYYSIVHPHFDEWTAHLCFDEFGRIFPRNGDAKGTATISICGIYFLNAARLADHFQPAYRNQTQKALEVLCGEDSLIKKQKKLKLLRALVEGYGLESAIPVLELLEAECGEANAML
ncbi:hypothetical protein [Pseudomonas yamanorum]|uniref:HNH endonuclease n=1 Tax=Pseudomonas yamanorum TaxID=515393 RepID=A0A7Y8EIQ9_9PSED|nr:hypothetical protein [Pseudomonas yamanorum]NWE15414.1 hypothetical protein [Pseudomonas yamanorum]